MANVTIAITLELSDDVDGGWFVIDDQDVNFTRGRGSATVVGSSEHSFQFWFAGVPGGSLSYEIRQGTSSLARGKSTISAGRRYGRGGGDFKVT